jgi:pyruvate formate-lyase/glycerol dehydratase family glycyl radical enzyme
MTKTERLRDSIIGVVPQLCPERARFYTNAWREHEELPVAIRRAMAFKAVLEHQTVFIRPEELVVGNQAGRPVAAPVFPEYGMAWMEKELDTLSERRLDPFLVDEEAKEELIEIGAYWKGKTHYDHVKSETLRVLPSDYLKGWDPDNGILNDAVSNSGRMSTGDGHVIVNFEKILRVGLRGIIEEAQEEMRRAEESITEYESMQKKLFLESVIISQEAAIAYANRYSQCAWNMAKEEKDSSRRKELKTIAQICSRVPEKPAAGFWEALQSYWFVHLILQIESNGHSMSFGRYDQYLFPYYKHDLEEGKITEDQARELIECMFVKANEVKKIKQMSHTRKMHGYPLFQTLTIGGQKRDGTDATNALSYLVLEATKDVRLQEPTTVARIHPRTPTRFLTACCECVVEHGGGLPGFFNDEIAIPLLMSTGVTLEDARDWAVDGCCEPIIPAKHNPINGGSCHHNLLKMFEMALHNGVNPRNGLVLCPGNGDLSEMDTFSKLVEGFQKQLRFYVKAQPVLDSITSRAHADLNPCPFLSGLLDYRMQIGKDAEEGGPPNYNNTLSICHGTVNVGNALAAVKEVVYDEKRITPSQLFEALEENFESEQGQMIRRMLLDAPKYGNDIDEVDYLVRDVLNWYVDEITSYAPVRGGYYCPSPQTLSANAYSGEVISATPDGRKAGEPTADNISPSAGTDVMGATAVMKSVAKLDHARATNGTILNMKLHPTAVRGAERLAKFASLVRSFFDLQGFQVQFNIVSAETLKKAKKTPERYRTLVVKVAGYSALFVTLDEQLQDQIISRTEHVV